MIKRDYGAIILIAVFIFTAVFSVPVYANSAAPPSLTIVVLNAPDDIEIYSADGSEKAYREFSLSDPLFRFYEGETFPNAIMVKAEGRETLLELPAENISGYDKYAVLDYKAMELSVGQPAWRAPLLIFLRVSFTLIIEGIVFLLFGFRTKRDAAVFLTINILTQAALNIISEKSEFLWQTYSLTAAIGKKLCCHHKQHLPTIVYTTVYIIVKQKQRIFLYIQV